MFEFKSIKNMFVALGAAALVVIGLAIVIYVSIARDRITPEATATPTPWGTPTATLSAVATSAPTASAAVSATPTPVVSVRGTVSDYEPGALIIVITPLSGDIDQIIVPENLEVTWEDGSRASPQDITVGLQIAAEGDLDSLGRLIAQRIVLSGAGTTPTAIASQTPTVTATGTPATSIPLGAWLGEYYDNASLSGTAVVVRQDASIDFNWGNSSPAADIPSDGFAVRWRGRWQFTEGTYRFTAYSDDGMRVWIDGALIINQWRDQEATQVSAESYLSAGQHTIQVEYYDRGGQAIARFWWESLGQYPDWKAEYYGNTALDGTPAVVRNDAEIDFDWGAASPASGVPANNFGVRWSRSQSFSEGNYRFLATADDGIRLWVDGILVIDQWHDSTLNTYSGYMWLTGGAHDLRVDYYEGSGDAHVHLWWERSESFPDWRGEYYANPDLSGQPRLLRNDSTLSFDWGDGSPAVNLPADGFSARWTRTVHFDKGRYRFWVIPDDGARVYVDDTRIIDEWQDGGAELYAGEISLDSGDHVIKVEYYEDNGSASIEVGWGVLQTPTPTLTPVTSATPTASATPQPATPTPTTPAPTATPTTGVVPSATPTATPTATPGDPTVPPVLQSEDGWHRPDTLDGHERD